jgi:hypothetical protein
MSYPFPTTVTEPATLQKALAIALYYLERTSRAAPFSTVEHTCAYVILEEWRAGQRHPIWLANKAIVAVEDRLSLSSSAEAAR